MRGWGEGASLTLSSTGGAEGREGLPQEDLGGTSCELGLSSREVGVSWKVKDKEETPLQGSRPLHTFRFRPTGSVTLYLPTCSVWPPVCKGQGRQRPHP